jgi:hypothetical protein
MTQLINEAKRLQQLAGINEMKINPPSPSEPGGNFIWWLPRDKRDPNQLIHMIDDDEYIPQDEDGGGTYERPWAHHGDTIRSKDMDASTIRDYVDDGNDDYERDEDGDYIFMNLEGENILTSGYIEGKDYIVISMENIAPLMEAYAELGGYHNFLKHEFNDGYARYLENNNGVLKTNTPYWKKLVDIVGKDKIQKYSMYLKRLGIKIV